MLPRLLPSLWLAATALGAQQSLTRAEAEAAADRLRSAWFGAGKPVLATPEKPPERGSRLRRWRLKASTGEVMPYVYFRRGEVAAGERQALFICLHGGGRKADAKGPHSWRVNDREWRVQTAFAIRRYPESGLCFVPRMADDRKGRWYHGHNHELFIQVIRDAVRYHGADPDRIYILGISEGAYGIYELAPFMADSLAAVNPMTCAANCLLPNLRNLPFRTDIGGQDTTYDRIGHARRVHQKLQALHEQDPGGFVHQLAVQEKRGHGIDYFRGQPWMVRHRRQTRPTRVLWTVRQLHGQFRRQFYWLGLGGEARPAAKHRWLLAAEVERSKNLIRIKVQQQGPRPKKQEGQQKRSPRPDPTPLEGLALRLYLDDQLCDLDREVRVLVNGKQRFSGRLQRSLKHLEASLAQRQDPGYIVPVILDLPGG